MICELHVIDWVLSVPGEMAVNINRILCNAYVEDGILDDNLSAKGILDKYW